MISISKEPGVRKCFNERDFKASRDKALEGDPGSADGSGKPGKLPQSPQYILATDHPRQPIHLAVAAGIPRKRTSSVSTSRPAIALVTAPLASSLLQILFCLYFLYSHFSLEGRVTSLSPQLFPLK